MASTISGSIEAENSRQGVEITGFAQVFASALPRILSNSSPKLVLDGKPINENGYFDESVTTQIASRKLEIAPNHQAERRDLGVPKTHYDDTPFEEILPLDPVSYVGDESWDTRYPIVLDASSPIDPGIYDGVIEPLSIRDIATRTNTEAPFESRRVRGTWANAHEDLLGRSVPLDQKVYYENYQGQTRAYQEFGDNLERPLDAKFTYFPDEPLLSVPFEDSDDSSLMASRVTDKSFAEVLEKATGSYTKFGLTFRSTNNGYTFRDTENGTDSLTFLDRISYLSGSSPFNSRQRVLRRSSPINIGFSDADTTSKSIPFDATRTVVNSQLYYPGAESRNAIVSGYKNQDLQVLASSSLIQRNVLPITEEISHPEFKDDITKHDLLLYDGTYAKSFFKIDISSRANWDPAHETYQLGPKVYDFRDSVIAHWNFETAATGSGTTIEDKSGNGHDGTLTGAASVDLVWSPGPITTRGSLNLEFNATNASNHDSLRVPDDPEINFALAEEKSISFWVRFATLNALNVVFSKFPQHQFYVDNNGSVYFILFGRDSGSNLVNHSVNVQNLVTTGRWYHFVVTWDGSTDHTKSVQIYLDGQKQVLNRSAWTATPVSIESSSNPFFIGRYHTLPAADLIGRVSSFEIWNKDFTDDESSAVYKIQLQGTQYMGRIDSAMASLTKTPNWFGGSLFLSSAFRNVSSSFDRYNGHETGVAGTGFYYYSPFYKRWIEKRSDHATSISNSRYWTGSGGNTRSKDETDAVNAIEVNAKEICDVNAIPTPTSPQLAESYIARNDSGFRGMVATASYWFSSKLYVTGTDRILSQFSSSPQLGYFLPYKEELQRSGYETIGTPTVNFNAPNSPKYHAFDEETIKLSDYIDRPFLLRKMIVKLPVQLHRRNDMVDSGFGSDKRWKRNTASRKDIDNYTFFLYRQRRTSKYRDSLTDVSSSVRFLIASSSVCVYNSASFGQAEFDGFYETFGDSTPLSQSFAGGLFSSTYLKDLTNYMITSGSDPITVAELTRVNSPLHSPAFSVNAGLSSSLDGVIDIERYLAQGGLKLTSYPTVVLGNYAAPSLFHVTSSTGHLSTSFYFNTYGVFAGNTDCYNQLFNRYPYTGSFSSINDSTRSPPITTIVQNFWFGGTRQPTFAVPSPSISPPNNQDFAFRPYMQFLGTEEYFKSEESLKFKTSNAPNSSSYTEPTFDIEIGRVGLTLFDDKSNVFENPFDISIDGRSLPITLGRRAKPSKAGVIQRSNLINFQSQSSEDSHYYGSQSTIGHLSGSSIAELIASLTVGYAPVSSLEERQIQRDYLLMPTDELILGLDAGVTPPPDVAPMFGSPRPDFQSLTPLPVGLAGAAIARGATAPTRSSSGGVKPITGGRALSKSPTPLKPTTVTLGGDSTTIIDTTPTRTAPVDLTGVEITTPKLGAVETASGGEFPSGGGGGTAFAWLEDSPFSENGIEIVGWSGMNRASKWKDWGSFIDIPAIPIPPAPRPPFTPFISPIMRETLPHYSGNSYIRILHGEAEIILVGEYLADGAGKQITRSSFSEDFTQTVGDNFIVDKFDNAEGDALLGTYLSDIITGSIFSGNRGVALDGASRSTVSGSNVQRFVKMNSNSILIHDLYFSGVNESPATAFRNAPQLVTFVTSSLDGILGGRPVASGSFFRGMAALKRKPAISVSAYFRPDHWGYMSDLVQGVENTKTYDSLDPAGAKIGGPAVTVRFVSGDTPELPIRTSSQNVSKTSAVDTPYVDGQAVSRTPIDDDDIVIA